MTPAPLVSIVTPSFNQGRFIRATIESVLAQTHANVEYLVVDGGSTDQTVSILEEFGDRIAWTSEPDRGQSHAINKGFEHARGEIVSWVNSDDVLLPHAASLAVEAFTEHPDAGFVYGDAYVIDEEGYTTWASESPEPDPWLLANAYDYVAQPAAFFRRASLAEVGWIDESWHWAMDWDVFMRLSLGFESVHIPAPMAYARLHDGAKTSSGGLARLAEIDRFIRTYSERRLPSVFWRYLLDTSLLECGRLGRRATAALRLDPLVPGLVLQRGLAPLVRRLERRYQAGGRPLAVLDCSPTPRATELERRLERHSSALGAIGRLANHPIRALHPDPRPLRRARQARYLTATTFWGAKLTVCLPDASSRSVLRLGYADPELSSFLIGFLRDGMTVLEIGAQFGYRSLLAAECVGGSGAVHAFEPTPASARVLRANAAGHPTVKVIEAAAWTHDGGAELFDHGETLSAYNSPRDVLPFPLRVPGASSRQAVATIALDSYCAEHGIRPALVTIDARGVELEVLAGMGGLLADVRPAITLAVGDLGFPDVARGREVIEQLLGYGYRAFEPRVGSLRPHRSRRHYADGSLVFLV